MAENSKIEWCDHTANLWWGCANVHSGCKNCFAETISHRWGNDVWGNDKPRKAIKSVWDDLNRFQRKAQEAGEMQTVFVGSMMDIFEKPMQLINSKGTFLRGKTTGDIRSWFFTMIDDGHYNNLIFLFLTKRPSNINKMIPLHWKDKPPKNVWFGTSVSDQETANKLIPQLILPIRRGNFFLSVEPQVGAIDLKLNTFLDSGHKIKDLIGWVIQGGESGHNKRPFDLSWAYYMKDQCKAAGVPFFFKQIDKVQSIPADLMVREFPNFLI